jgi:hypothetical protein
MTQPRVFALICWLLWLSLVFAGMTKQIQWVLAGEIAVTVLCLWVLYRQAIKRRV